MKYYSINLLTAILISFLSVSYAQDNVRNNLKKENFKGNARTIATYTYGVDSKLEKKELWDECFCGYDDKGNPIQENYYQTSGYSFFKIYDRNGKIIEDRTHNSDGQMVNSKYTYKYDNKGSAIEMNHYSSNGNLEYKYTYKYDSQGNQIEENQYRSYSDGSLMEKNIYKYDSKGNEIELLNVYDPGIQPENPHYKRTREYDNNGNLLEVNRYQSSGSLEKETYKYYDYDYKGNWLKKILYLNDYPRSITVRIIEYYSK